MCENAVRGDNTMPTQKTENDNDNDAKAAKKPVKAKNLPKSSNANQSARAASSYARAARPPVARAGR